MKITNESKYGNIAKKKKKKSTIIDNNALVMAHICYIELQEMLLTKNLTVNTKEASIFFQQLNHTLKRII